MLELLELTILQQLQSSTTLVVVKMKLNRKPQSFGVLSLDKSLVARLKYSGHATKLTLSNDGKGELTGSNLNAGDKEEESSLNEVFNLNSNLLHITVLNNS